MNNPRKHHTAEEKVSTLRRHLIEKVPVSTLCDEYQLHPTVFYRWLKVIFENGAAAFGPAPRADKQLEAREQRIAALEKKRFPANHSRVIATWVPRRALQAHPQNES
ncbi:MAG TPA: transposase [Terriglobia bacterium]|nr:transposase [Terriglobia bacterium]